MAYRSIFTISRNLLFVAGSTSRIAGSMDLTNLPDVSVVLASDNGLAYRHCEHGSIFYICLCRCINGLAREDNDLESIVNFSFIPELIEIMRVVGPVRPVLASSLQARVRMRFDDGGTTSAEEREFNAHVRYRRFKRS